VNSAIAATGFKIVVLLSTGSFQATLALSASQPSPEFEDSAQGVQSFFVWLRPLLPAPSWNQAPKQICVVGATHFSARTAPYLPKPLYESQSPWHSLEPYAASFHYAAAGAAQRTMSDARRLCGLGARR
jgi:hypothetical protein